MATIGLSKPYFAVYSNEGSTVTYKEGGLIGKATELKLDLEGAKNNALYADNGPAESDNQFAGGTLTISTDDLLPKPMMAILGLKEEKIVGESGLTTENASWIISDDTQQIPYCGFGGIIKKKINGAIKWVAVVYTKVQFNNPGESAVTQGETIEWQTKELSASIMRDDTTSHAWRFISSPLDTEADAELLIKKKLSIAGA